MIFLRRHRKFIIKIKDKKYNFSTLLIGFSYEQHNPLLYFKQTLTYNVSNLIVKFNKEHTSQIQKNPIDYEIAFAFNGKTLIHTIYIQGKNIHLCKYQTPSPGYRMYYQPIKKCNIYITKSLSKIFKMVQI